jgi:large subunit ribosomal protein L4
MQRQPKTRAARRQKRATIEKAITGAVKKASGHKEFSVQIYDMKGKKVSTFTPDKDLFTGEVNEGALYQAVVMYNAKKRQGNASTKTRGDVSGGGKKPFRQKGTGQARAGSTRSPLWRHGGTIFGPHTRDYSYSIPKAIKRLAFLSSINSKLNDNKVLGLDSMVVAEPKTRKVAEMLAALKVDAGKTLLVLDSIDPNVMRASGNIAKLKVRNYKDVNTVDVLTCDTVVMSKKALEKLPERLKGLK